MSASEGAGSVFYGQAKSAPGFQPMPVGDWHGDYRPTPLLWLVKEMTLTTSSIDTALESVQIRETAAHELVAWAQPFAGLPPVDEDGVKRTRPRQSERT